MPYADPLTDDELAAALAALPDWTRDGDMLRRTVKVGGFTQAADLVRAVAGQPMQPTITPTSTSPGTET